MNDVNFIRSTNPEDFAAMLSEHYSNGWRVKHYAHTQMASGQESFSAILER